MFLRTAYKYGSTAYICGSIWIGTYTSIKTCPLDFPIGVKIIMISGFATTYPIISMLELAGHDLFGLNKNEKK